VSGVVSTFFLVKTSKTNYSPIFLSRKESIDAYLFCSIGRASQKGLVAVVALEMPVILHILLQNKSL